MFCMLFSNFAWAQWSHRFRIECMEMQIFDFLGSENLKIVKRHHIMSKVEPNYLTQTVDQVLNDPAKRTHKRKIHFFSFLLRRHFWYFNVTRSSHNFWNWMWIAHVSEIIFNYSSWHWCAAMGFEKEKNIQRQQQVIVGRKENTMALVLTHTREHRKIQK